MKGSWISKVDEGIFVITCVNLGYLGKKRLTKIEMGQLNWFGGSINYPLNFDAVFMYFYFLNFTVCLVSGIKWR